VVHRHRCRKADLRLVARIALGDAHGNWNVGRCLAKRSRTIMTRIASSSSHCIGCRMCERHGGSPTGR
jgi:hypothetical protein